MCRHDEFMKKASPPQPPVPLPEISTDELRSFVQTRREPCIIRSAGNQLKIAKGCACSSRETAVEDGIVGGVQWLAQQIGSTKFRVFVSRPADASKKQQQGTVFDNGTNNTNASTFTLDGTDCPHDIHVDGNDAGRNDERPKLALSIHGRR